MNDITCDRIEKEYTSFSAIKIFGANNADATGFTAQLSADSAVSPGTIVFDEEVIDIDGDYNNITGEYTVPADGFYVFSTSVHLNSSSAQPVLRQNGNVEFYGPRVVNSQSEERDSGTSTMTRVIQCQQNDVITVTHTTSRYVSGCRVI